MRWRLPFLACCCASLFSNAETFYRSDSALSTGPNVVAIAVADLNDDGLPDIITADRGRLSDPHDERPANDQLSFFVASGPLKYIAQPQLRAGFAPYALKIVNVDALRAPDIVAVSFMAARDRDLTLFRNLGESLFEPVGFSVPDDDVSYARMVDGAGEPVFTTPGLTALEVYDFDQDGYRDAVATAWSSDVLVYFPGHIEKYFDTPRMIELDGAPRDIARADFNQDGRQDLAVALYARGKIAILEGDGTGNFTQATEFYSRGELPAVLRTADFDADGVPDLLVGHGHGDDSLVIFRGTGDGQFSLSQEIMLADDRTSIDVGIRDVAVGDFDGNGRTDIAATGFETGELIVLMNRAGSAFPLDFARERYRLPNGRPHAVAAADLNQDGKTDLVVSTWGADRLEFFIQR